MQMIFFLSPTIQLITCPQPSGGVVQLWEGEGPRDEGDTEGVHEEEGGEEAHGLEVGEPVEPHGEAEVGEDLWV